MDRCVVFIIELGSTLLTAEYDQAREVLVLHTATEPVVLVPVPGVPLKDLDRAGRAAILREFPDARVFVADPDTTQRQVGTGPDRRL